MISTIKRYLTTLNTRQWLYVYLLASLLLVLKITFNQHDWLNNDSLLYLEQARLIGLGEFKAAAHLLSWIFYPTLIAGTAKITSLDLHTAAQLLNIVLFISFVWGYHQLLVQLGARQDTLHWAMLLLLSTRYMVGDILGMLLRDEGYWAAFVWALLYFVRFVQQQRWRDALLFQICMSIATLFRIEGAVYLLALPLLLLLPSTSIPMRYMNWLRINCLALLSGLLLTLACLSGELSLGQLGRLQELYSMLVHLMTHSIQAMNDKADIMGKQVLGGFLDDYAHLSVWASLILIVLVKTLKVAGWPVIAVVLLGPKVWWSLLSRLHRQLTMLILGLGFIISLVNILNVMVLSSRYVISSGIVFLTLAPFAISAWRRPPAAYWQPLLASLLVLLLYCNLIDRSHPDLDRLSVNYVRQINTKQQAVFYDTENARFYAKQPYMNRIGGFLRFKQTMADQELTQYAIYVITLSADDAAYGQEANSVLARHGYHQVHTLYGWRKKTRALIYVKPDHH